MAQDTNQNRPADVAQADSVGGMAKRLLNPAHLSDLARRSAATLKEQGAEQLWRDVTFRVGLATMIPGSTGQTCPCAGS